MPYVIVIYDVSKERVGKIKTFLNRYLYWVQNSAFEGELSESQLAEVRCGLHELLRDEDSVYIYKFPSMKSFRKEVLGQERGRTEQIV